MNVRARATHLTTTLTAAVALALGGTVTLPAHAAGPSSVIANDTVWTDTDGNPILAQGGNVLKVGATYYWVGTKLVSGRPKQVNLYSSTDLENWTFRGPVLSQSGTEGPLAATGNLWLGRPQLIRNPATGTFVLVVEVTDPATKRNHVLFATSPTVDGAYKPTDDGATPVNGTTMGDHSVFVDGSDAYLVYVGDQGGDINSTLNVAPLDTNWTKVKPAVWSERNTGHKEAPGIVKAGATYYMFASGMDWWNATPTSYRTGKDMSSWGQDSWKSVATRPASDNSYGTQFEQIIPVVGTQGTSYLYNGDRYSQYHGTGAPAPGGIGHNAWYPLTFEGGVPRLHGYTDVDVDAAAGTVTGNPVANGRFDQDVTGSRIPQWGVTGAARVDESTVGDGRRQLTLWDDAAYSAWADQQVALPNGSYKLSFDYRTSGGQNNAYFEVKDHGSAAVRTDLTTKQGAWTTKTVNFTVTSGKANLGIWADSAKDTWLNVDNVSVLPAG
ncbi:family 43 glycosylhydrolase [Streptomyces sp. NPDC059883]|uniref:family 43 glycosylhydrolase n=2 Tax=Streptomyces TaxID=1883 RepID=UPI00364849E6